MISKQAQSSAILPAYIQQPGPAGAKYSSVTTRLEELDFELPAGVSLDIALAQEIKARGLAGAYLRTTKAEMSKMEYFIPALSPNDDHVAWYSKTLIPSMPGRIEDAGFICGSLSGKPFYHSHGLLSDASQLMAMGHLLPETCFLSSPARVVGLGFKDARFNRVYDPETNFDLFVPERLTTKATDDQGILLRIAPNTEISLPLIECCQKAGWKRASVHGVGSLIGAHFSDGRIMNSFATEFLITEGAVDLSGTDPSVVLEIALVGLDGKFMQGQLAAQGNPVLITSEIILKNQPEDPVY